MFVNWVCSASMPYMGKKDSQTLVMHTCIIIKMDIFVC